MQNLSQAQYRNAVRFLKSEAQDIDRAMFETFFEGLPLAEAVRILESY